MKFHHRKLILNWVRRQVAPGGFVSFFELQMWAQKAGEAWALANVGRFRNRINAAVIGHPGFALCVGKGKRVGLRRGFDDVGNTRWEAGLVVWKGYEAQLVLDVTLDGTPYPTLDAKSGVQSLSHCKSVRWTLDAEGELHGIVQSRVKSLKMRGLSVDGISSSYGGSPPVSSGAANLPPLGSVLVTIDRDVPLPEPYSAACYPVREVMELLGPALKQFEIGWSILTPKEFGGNLLRWPIHKAAAEWRKAGVIRGYRCRLDPENRLRIWRYR